MGEAPGVARTSATVLLDSSVERLGRKCSNTTCLVREAAAAAGGRKFSRCGACRRVYYCSTHCQVCVYVFVLLTRGKWCAGALLLLPLNIYAIYITVCYSATAWTITRIILSCTKRSHKATPCLHFCMHAQRTHWRDGHSKDCKQWQQEQADAKVAALPAQAAALAIHSPA
jgi:hypothetical protein